MNENEEEREMEVCTAPDISQTATEMISLDFLPSQASQGIFMNKGTAYDLVY